MSTDLKQLGATGERLAEAFLRKKGFTILARNFTCPGGELDLICFGEGAIVFVEVKTRQSDASADPESNITPFKQKQMQKAAQYWLQQHRQPNCAWRFDAVTVVMPPDGEPRVRHIVEAFRPRR